jgi:hypothetical protein
MFLTTNELVVWTQVINPKLIEREGVLRKQLYQCTLEHKQEEALATAYHIKAINDLKVLIENALTASE